jgi:outer membrane protein TolC
LAPPPVEIPPAPPIVCEPLPPVPAAHPEPIDNTPQLIDLPTALRLADGKNPNIALARERIREALAQQERAEVLWLPHLEFNPTWLRHDGQLQRSTGEIINVSRSSLGVTGGPALNFDWGDALFAKLAFRQLTEAREAAATAVANTLLLDVALAYTDLLQTYAELRIADEARQNAKALYDLMLAHDKVGKAVPADIARARTELNQRERELVAVQGRIDVVSARLAELLYLPSSVSLRPVETAFVPLTMVQPEIPVNDLIVHGLRNRPELAEHRAYIEASLEFWRSAKVAPFVPELRLIYNGGGYGGGRNSHFSEFDWRGDAGAMAYWRLDNLGFGNLALVRERESQYNQTNFRVIALENNVAAQIVTASSFADARRRELAPAQTAVESARESYKLNLDRVRRAPEQARPIELLQAIQALQRSQADYLNVIADYNRAQFRLYTALGSPPQCALDETTPIPNAALPLTPAKNKE